MSCRADVVIIIFIWCIKSQRWWNNDVNSFFFTENNPQLDWTIGFVPGQVAEISANFNKNPLLSLEVALDDAHFLKSKHSYNTDAAKDLVVSIIYNSKSESILTCFQTRTVDVILDMLTCVLGILLL